MIICAVSGVYLRDNARKGVGTRKRFACCKAECCVNDFFFRRRGSDCGTEVQRKYLRIRSFAAGKGSRKGYRCSFCRDSKRKFVSHKASIFAFANRPSDFYVRVVIVDGRKGNRLVYSVFALNVDCFFNSCDLQFRSDAVLANHFNKATNVVACAASIADGGSTKRHVRGIVTKIEVAGLAVLVNVKVRTDGTDFCIPEEVGNGSGIHNNVVVCAVVAQLNTDISLYACFIKVNVEVVRAFDVFNVKVGGSFVNVHRCEVVTAHFASEVAVGSLRALVNVKFVGGVFSRLFRDSLRNSVKCGKTFTRKFYGCGVAFAIGNGCGKHVCNVCGNVRHLDNRLNIICALYNLNACSKTCFVNRPSDVVAEYAANHFIIVTGFLVCASVHIFKIFSCVCKGIFLNDGRVGARFYAGLNARFFAGLNARFFAGFNAGLNVRFYVRLYIRRGAASFAVGRAFCGRVYRGEKVSLCTTCKTRQACQQSNKADDEFLHVVSPYI